MKNFASKNSDFKIFGNKKWKTEKSTNFYIWLALFRMFSNICMEIEEMEEKSKTVKKFLGLRMKANSRSNSLIRILGGMSSLNTVELIKRGIERRHLYMIENLKDVFDLRISLRHSI